MSASDRLYYAVLAMDSYNRLAADGSGSRALAVPGDTGDPEETIFIGNALLRRAPLPSGSASVGFFATAYTLIGDTIISFRGTDSQAGMGELAEDVFFGWASGTGAYSPQTLFAEQFKASERLRPPCNRIKALASSCF